MSGDLISLSAWALRVGVSAERAGQWARAGRLNGATKPARDWLIPANLPRPEVRAGGRPASVGGALGRPAWYVVYQGGAGLNGVRPAPNIRRFWTQEDADGFRAEVENHRSDEAFPVRSLVHSRMVQWFKLQPQTAHEWPDADESRLLALVLSVERG